MPETLKVLGQSAPTVALLTTFYTVPASTSTVVSSVTICNTSATATTYRLVVAVAGAATTNSQYIAYDAAIAGNDTVALTLGITLAATDLLRCYATLATLSFSAFGVEKT